MMRSASHDDGQGRPGTDAEYGAVPTQSPAPSPTPVIEECKSIESDAENDAETPTSMASTTPTSSKRARVINHLNFDLSLMDLESTNARPSRVYTSPSGMSFELFRRRWLLLGIICYTGLTNNMLFNGFGGIATEAAEYFDVSTFLINTLVSLGFFLVMISTFPAMWVVDKLGILNGYVIGVAVNVIGAWIRYVGAANPGPMGYYTLLAGQILVSIATPFVTSLPAPLAARWFAPDEQAIVNAIGGVMQFAGFAGGLVLGVYFQNAIELYVFIQAVLQTVQIVGFFFIRDKPPIPPGPKAEVVPFELMKATKIIFGSGNAVRLLLALGFLVVPWATYFSLMDQVSPPSTHAQRATIAMLMFFAGVIGAGIAGVVMDKTNAYIGLARFLSAFGVVNFVIMGFAWLYDIGPLVWITSLALGGFGMPFVPMSIELNIEFTFTPGLNLEATITGFVTVVSNFFSFVGLYLSDPELLGFDNKWIGFVWCVFVFIGVGLLSTLTPEYKRQAFLKAADAEHMRKSLELTASSSASRRLAKSALDACTNSMDDSEDDQISSQL
uniref:Major facilitator superfamily (MFS) profile domain-containing protein n=1 Tax=Phaeomonas parva TaxID=124430 RepID=A0A7S1TP08_9STRA|mmetsp:Transcript_11112/g.33794  ORF Transcript_11112/g.33794 Transcript_11112/m.33794 type:complete len:555 (+) Transcript_11112:337-2001(+)|eukprot:CAMPEP_0118876082 /NCGR_PEP_ID=MMETSP1163-20130328/16913_1 /TAXON_ID=124430 /ORGANISM="Phaeomonas parva, Strain CCMP2877" /LENGTH=554 /DNA_ID=CAMNT_0006811657 /DNA_START=241 /DNA_END=1905 /DNA_ORIENTATION=-